MTAALQEQVKNRLTECGVLIEWLALVPHWQGFIEGRYILVIWRVEHRIHFVEQRSKDGNN